MGIMRRAIHKEVAARRRSDVFLDSACVYNVQKTASLT